MATIFATITELSEIVTDAITAGNDTNIPSRLIRNTLVKVSTGKYYEVLPIIVPAECCVLGDELRSTNVQPRTSTNSTLTPVGDFKYSYQALDRIENIISDIVDGTTVTPTTGNAQAQVQTWPLVDVPVAKTASKRLARTIRRRADFSLGNKLEAEYPAAYDMASPVYGYARDLLLANKEFLKAEIIAYIGENYPNLKYSRTKCKQDTGYIIDSLVYDLTFDGNWQSVKAGEAYYEGATLNINSSEKTATLAAYGYLKNLVQTVSQNIAVTPVEQTTVSQIRNGTYNGNSTTSSKLASLMQNIIDIITNGSGSVAITYPDVSGVDGELKQARNRILNEQKQIQENTIDFINGHFGSFKYNSAKCRRDLRTIITDTSYDIALGTNFNAVYTGMAYQRPNNSYNLNTQRTETIGAIRNARDLLKESVTDDGSSAGGSSNASTRITTAYNEIVDIITNGTLGTVNPGDGVVNALSLPSPTGVDQNRVDAKDNLVANRTFIIDEIVSWINNEIADGPGSSGDAIWDGFTYNSTKCGRDVGYIVDAMSYDILYGGTQATTRVAQSYFGYDGNTQIYGQSAQTAAAYARLATVLSQVVQESSVTTSPGTTELQTTLGTPATATEASEIDGNMQIIEDAITAGNLNSLPTVVYPDITWADAEYQTAHSNILSDQEDTITNTIQFINTTYNDFNYNHSKCTRDIGFLVESATYDFMLDTNYASIQAAYSYLRAPSAKIIGDQKDATLAANEYVLSQIKAVANNGLAETRLDNSWEWIQDIIWSGSAEGGVKQTADVQAFNAVRLLELNKEFIVQEALNYVDEYFKKEVTSVNLANDRLTISDTTWLERGMEIKFVDADDSSLSVENAGLTDATTYYVDNIHSATEFTISSTKYGSVFDFNESDIGGFFVTKAYEYNRTLCARDVREYIEAIKWDLQWPKEQSRIYNSFGFNVSLYLPASYKTRLAARYYVNSLIGSQEEDMYYLRNGTGLRLQTLDGLRGDLGPANAYGTSRPTAGAYASLDPGWGPDDQRVWITARSPYVQNVSTFGFAAIGQKIDGALHNGGNDSIVSNDFTQVISDGIGAWITNNGRAELVSVFTYYSHIGYLAENGGRIRGTNGNNSYGTFGSVAEGVDPDETPVTAIVDNSTQYNATIGKVLTDGADEILQVEYSHAGNDYTEANLRFFGVGDNEQITMEDFRDGAVFQNRVIEVDDSTGNPDATAGGSGYVNVSNTAQTGSSNSITLAATDGNLSSAYPGMRLYINSGAGGGLNGIIFTYDSGTKVAGIVREKHVVTAGNFNGTSKYRIDTSGNTDFTAIGAADSNPGTLFTATGAGSGTGTATLLEDGWDQAKQGGSVATTPNSTSTYVIEPAAFVTEPPKSDSQHSLASATYTAMHFVESSAQYTGQSVTTQSDGTGATFDVTRVGRKYYVALNNAGSGYTRLDTLTILGSNLGGADTTHDITITITSINSNTGAIVDFDFTGLGREGHFVAVPTGSTTAQYSIDGQTWSNTSLTNAWNWTDITSGLQDDGSSTFKQSYAIAAANNGGSTAINYSTSGIGGWTAPASQPSLGVTTTASVAFGQVAAGVSRFVLIADNDQDISYSDDGGISWTTQASALPATGATKIVYGKGKFVVITGGSTNVYTSTDGITYTNNVGVLPDTHNWVDIAFGDNVFVAIADDNLEAAYSIDGITWTATTVVTGGPALLPRQIEFGQGTFVVTTADDNTIAISPNGFDWEPAYTLNDLYTSGLRAIAAGSVDETNKFVAIQTGTTTNVLNAQIGARPRMRVGIASEKVFEIRLIDPGSGYSTAPDIVITDPNNINDALVTVRIGNGVLTQPTYIARGSGFIDATAEVDADNSNGNANFFQDGSFIAVRRLSATPVNGSNVVFDSLPNQVFKLVNTVSLVGTNDGSKTAFLQISPTMEIEDTPINNDPVTLRIRFSQTRLTGHDFLDIGTGNFDDTNYPNNLYGDPVNNPSQTNETLSSGGGRVFFTSTDQDGNFRVGDLFSIEQSTGVATLNADAFNIAGLQELTLGEVTLGGNSASVTEFSTDPFFTANSDSVVPTQRAVKAYIEAQIGGGGASLIVNSVTAGDIFIGTNQITTVTGQPINIKANVNFTGSVLGLPLAFNYLFR